MKWHTVYQKWAFEMKDIKKCSSCSSFCFSYFIHLFILNNKCVQFYRLLFYYVGYFNLSGYNM